MSVVAPTFRRVDGALRLLQALARQEYDPASFEVIIVDDCSGDGSVERLRSEAAKVSFRLEVLSTPANQGPAAARNLGWRTAGAEHLAFVDDDCVPAPGWLAAGVRVLDQEPGVGVVQGPVRPPAEAPGDAELPLWNHRQRIDGPSPYFEACNIFYRRKALTSVGGFSEEFPRWGEDTAAGWAVLEAGWERRFARDAVVVHDVSIRGWRWWARMALAERVNVVLAARHPQLRKEAFWRPWALRREDAAFAGAVGAALIGMWWRPALALGLPYVAIRRPSLRRLHQGSLRRLAEEMTVDACRFAGHLRGSAQSGILVL